jgi:PAS domain S-box-containing protein
MNYRMPQNSEPVFQPLLPESLWRAGSLVWLTSLGLAMAALLTLGAFCIYERNEALSSAQARAELLARMLEDQATRTIENTALNLRSLGDSIALLPTVGPDTERLQVLLMQSQLGLTFIRSMAVLDLQGRVLASTAVAELGLQIDLNRLSDLPPEGRDRLLPLLPGRGLSDLAVQGTERLALNSAPPAGVQMLPLLRRVSSARGQGLLLLALINPDSLANYQQMAMVGDEGTALLASFAGQLLTVTEQATLLPGSLLSQHPVFRDWLPDKEHGSYIGVGALPGQQIVAFRVSRTRPLVVLVELPRETVLQGWWQLNRMLAAMGLAALLLIAGAAFTVLRSHRSRERVRQALDQAHLQVAARERELRVLLKSVQELIFRTDEHGVITYVNARWAALNPAPADQAIGRRLQDVVVPADKLAVAALFDARDRGGVRNIEASVRRDGVVDVGASAGPGDGNLRRFDIAIVPLLLQGQIVGFAGSAVDVTERYVAQQRLQQQLAFTGLLLEISPLPVSMFDAKGHYVSVNQAWEDFTGRSRSDVVGHHVKLFTPPEEAVLHAEQDAVLLTHGGRLRYEMQLKHQDGMRRDMLITKVLVTDEQGGISGILCTLMDVSEFRIAERTTREARDLALEASQAKSEFIANISHELRTPLQSILGFSELGMMRGRATPKLAEMFSDVHASGQRMLALVNDLLDVSKIESSVGTFNLERSDLRGLIQSVLRELQPLIEKRHLRLLVQLPGEALSARVDSQRFQQVIRNLLANAIKFSPEGGPLELRAGTTANGEVHIEVADRGPGIPKAELEQIFEAFVQSSQTKDGSGGTGLGLAICRKIVEIHSGRIHARNRIDGGAVFHIYLPGRVVGDSQLGDLK